MTELLTPFQKDRLERAKKVCEMFKEVSDANPDTAVTARIKYITAKLCDSGTYITDTGVRNILKANNLYKL